MRPGDLYQQAIAELRQNNSAESTNRAISSGNHHDNVKVETAEGRFLVRIPIINALSLDLRLWPEAQILASLKRKVSRAPQLIHSSDDPPFQILSYLEGVPFRRIAPHGAAVPDHTFADITALLLCLTEIPLEVLPPLPKQWPANDSPSFAYQISAWTQKVYGGFIDKYSTLFSMLGIPEDPFNQLQERLSLVHDRPFSLLHGDLHRGNMLIHDQHCFFVDWELALWGDPVYELAIHLNKMRYQHSEEKTLLQIWSARLPPSSTMGWQEDLPRYRAHEHLRLAINDTVRYAQLWQSALSANRSIGDHLKEATTSIAVKLTNAYAVWKNLQQRITRDQVSESELAGVVQRWVTENPDI